MLQSVSMGRRTSLELDLHLRQARETRGLSQGELARLAGISRQALNAIEAGRYVPNTAVALRLARALGCAVEDLFVPRREARVEARWPVEVGSPVAGATSRVRLGRVRRDLVAWPLVRLDAATPADAIVTDQRARRVRVDLCPGAGPPERSLFVAGCDPALRLAAVLCERVTGVRVHWIPLSSLRALRAVRDGLVHAAGTHLHPPGDPEGVRTIHRVLRGAPVLVVALARWTEGMVLGPTAGPLRRAADLLRPGLRIVNRERGSGAREVFDRWLRDAGVPPERVRGYGRELTSHQAVAEAVASGLADAGPGVLPVARAYGLRFLPLAEQRFDLVIPQDLANQDVVQAFLEVLTGQALRRELAAIGGYDPAPAGSTRQLA